MRAHTWTAALLILLATACGRQSLSLHGNPYENPAQAGDLPLTDVQGSAFTLEDHAGQLALVFFGYANCPDVCPPTLHNVAWIFDQLGENAAGVSFIFVSVDPVRDTPETLSGYLRAFDPRFIGLIGTEEATMEAAREYGVFFAREDALKGQFDAESDSYLVAHTDRIFLIGPQGKLLTNYTIEAPRTEILDDLMSMLTEGS